MYRTDARRLMRGLPLLPANDPTSGEALPNQWWARYRCSPPLPPQRGSIVLVRTLLPPSVKRTDSALDSEISHPVSGSSTLQKSPAEKHGYTRTYFRRAFFLCLESTSSNRIRFEDDYTEHVVADLDVMMESSVQQDPLPLSPAPQSYSSYPSPTPLAYSPSGMLETVAEIGRLCEMSPYGGRDSARPIFVSPLRSLEVKSRSESHVECEVDVNHVAESMRLLDRKEDLLHSLRILNDMVSSSQDAADVQDESTNSRYKYILQELEVVDADLQFLMMPDPRLSPRAGSNLQHIPQPNFDTPDAKTRFAMPFLDKLTSPSPGAKPKDTGCASSPTGQSLWLRPEHVAKNVDFRNATGARLLAKALTRSALAELSDDSKLKTAPTSIRADVMECVSACVAVLVRARATRDYECIEEVISGIRVRFPENAEALEAIHEAARTFDSWSSDGV